MTGNWEEQAILYKSEIVLVVNTLNFLNNKKILIFHYLFIENIFSENKFSKI